MFSACMSLCMGRFKQRIRALTVTLGLTLTAIAVVLVAIGFGLSLLYVWLHQGYGTMPALAIMGGGCAVLASLLFSIAFFRPPRRSRPVRPEASALRHPAGAGEHSIDQAIGTMQHGSREAMLAALWLAVMAGIALGRKL